MKNLIQKLLILTFVVGGFLAPVQVSIEQSFKNNQSFDFVITQQTAYAQTEGPNDIQTTLSVECGSWEVGCHIGNFVLWYFELLWYRTTQVLAFIAGFTVDILLFHSISSATYRTGIVEAGWEILRNLINIVFIFSLLVVAFKMVLGSSSAKVKETLIKTIVVALVVNFSLFMSYVIIDASNILGNIFYSRIETEDAEPANLGQIGTDSANSLQSFFTGQEFASPSSAIVNNFNPQRIINNTQRAPVFFERWLIIFASGGINVLMIFLFVGIALLFLGRTIGLIFSAILAPLAFTTLTLPFKGVENLPYVGFGNWLKQLISLAFMAPVYLFFLYLIIAFSNNEALFNAIALNPEAGVLSSILAVVIPFALIAILLYTAKKVATKMAGDLGGVISNTITQVAKGAVKVAGAGVAIAATAGAAALTAGSTLAGAGIRGASATGGRWNNIGRRLQTTKFDVSRIPGFNQTIGRTGVGRAVARGVNTSYADVDTAVRGGANRIRGRINDVTTGRTPESVRNWSSNVEESRRNLSERRMENVSEQAEREARANAGAVERQYDYATRSETTVAVDNLPGRIRELRSERGMRDTAEVEAERTNIRNTTNQINADIQTQRDEIRRIEQNRQQMIRAGNTAGAAQATADIANSRQAIRQLEDNIREVERSSLDRRIEHLEEQLSERQRNARAAMFREDSASRGTTQDSNFTVNEARRQERVQTQAAQNNQRNNS